MLDEGYAAVTYRAVAAKAGVTAGLVQYYFPTLDDVFVAAIRRRSEQNLERLAAALRARPDEPFRVLWEYSQEESTAALTTEFLAFGNHRKSIRVGDRRGHRAGPTPPARGASPGATGRAASTSMDLSPRALLFLLTGIPKLIRLEEGVGVSSRPRRGRTGSSATSTRSNRHRGQREAVDGKPCKLDA